MGRFTIKTPFLRVLINIVITLIFGFVYFYVKLPAINLQDSEFYFFIGTLAVVYMALSLVTSGIKLEGGLSEYGSFVKKQCKIPAIVLVLAVIITVFGGITSWEVIRAGAYRDLITVENGDFATDVKEISYNKIPMLDSESAKRLGDRKLGELSDMVSQFEVADNYTQINFKNRPVRVTPLEYGDLIKWFNNRGAGLPAYLVIDMVTQEVDVVRLTDGIKYSPSEHFGRKLERHLRFNYPTFMFAEANFEIDEEGKPYWVCPRIVKKIGLFGGVDINGAVLVDAITGECEYFEEVPTWVDHVYNASLIMQQYDYHGTYINGFLNSIFGQKNVTVTTTGYNYIALNDDVYVYTGITSAGSDQSNVGFILCNQRTKDTKYYTVAGATEYSAMSSAEGVVQHLGYRATFPLLLNVSTKPTYFVALKDNAQLVKMYAMVNVEQYQVVATGASLAECEKNYIKLLAQNNITQEVTPIEDGVSGKIVEIRDAVIEGNTVYYLKLEGSENYYAISASDDQRAVTLNVGDVVEITYDTESDGKIKKVLSMK
ncbi:MAG: CvpA family protein [Clostridia bacterium]|nr:CvpA family protein [Clostridia bacterium]